MFKKMEFRNIRSYVEPTEFDYVVGMPVPRVGERVFGVDRLQGTVTAVTYDLRGSVISITLDEWAI